jgi:hypothetical protein
LTILKGINVANEMVSHLICFWSLFSNRIPFGIHIKYHLKGSKPKNWFNHWNSIQFKDLDVTVRPIKSRQITIWFLNFTIFYIPITLYFYILTLNFIFIIYSSLNIERTTKTCWKNEKRDKGYDWSHFNHKLTNLGEFTLKKRVQQT